MNVCSFERIQFLRTIAKEANESGQLMGITIDGYVKMETASGLCIQHCSTDLVKLLEVVGQYATSEGEAASPRKISLDAFLRLGLRCS